MLLKFDDTSQNDKFQVWMETVKTLKNKDSNLNIVVLEIGAGTFQNFSSFCKKTNFMLTLLTKEIAVLLTFFTF